MQLVTFLLPATIDLFSLRLPELIKVRLHNTKLEGKRYTPLRAGYIRVGRWIVLVTERGGLLLLFPTGKDLGPEGGPLVRTIRL